MKSQCLALAELKRKIAAIGFEMEYGQFMDYLPAVNSPSVLKFWRFMEKVGDRWWPQCAAVYGVVLTKHLIGVHPLPELESAFDGNTVALKYGTFDRIVFRRPIYGFGELMMPELPEVETTLRGITPHIDGKKIEKVIIRQFKLRWPIHPNLAQILAERKVLHATVVRSI